MTTLPNRGYYLTAAARALRLAREDLGQDLQGYSPRDLLMDYFPSLTSAQVDELLIELQER